MRSSLRAVTVALLLPVSTAAAQTTIGETSLPDGNVAGCSRTSSDIRCGQTFTVPVGNDVLQSFTFTLATTTGAAEFQIFQIAGTTLVGGPLFSQLLAPVTGAPLTVAPVGGLALTSGVEYAAVIFGNAPGESVQLSANTGTYAGGRTIFCGASSTCSAIVSGTYDARFQATFVPSTVPEPSTIALLGGGLLGVLGVARRRGRLG